MNEGNKCIFITVSAHFLKPTFPSLTDPAVYLISLHSPRTSITFNFGTFIASHSTSPPNAIASTSSHRIHFSWEYNIFFCSFSKWYSPCTAKSEIFQNKASYFQDSFMQVIYMFTQYKAQGKCMYKVYVYLSILHARTHHHHIRLLNNNLGKTALPYSRLICKLEDQFGLSFCLKSEQQLWSRGLLQAL